jgi:hypothetical protein
MKKTGSIELAENYHNVLFGKNEAFEENKNCFERKEGRHFN